MDDQKRTRVQLAVSLQVELEKAQQRNWTEFYTCDECRVLWKIFPKGCWLSLDEEPQNGFVQLSGREISADRFFNPKGFAIVDLLPQKDSFTAQSFIDQILKPLSQDHSTKSADIARRSLLLHFDNSRCHSAKIVSEEMTNSKCKMVRHPPYPPDLAIADFY
jgi:hypothetical protein